MDLYHGIHLFTKSFRVPKHFYTETSIKNNISIIHLQSFHKVLQLCFFSSYQPITRYYCCKHKVSFPVIPGIYIEREGERIYRI